jgi:hypothetical protein
MRSNAAELRAAARGRIAGWTFTRTRPKRTIQRTSAKNCHIVSEKDDGPRALYRPCIAALRSIGAVKVRHSNRRS